MPNYGANHSSRGMGMRKRGAPAPYYVDSYSAVNNGPESRGKRARMDMSPSPPPAFHHPPPPPPPHHHHHHHPPPPPPPHYYPSYYGPPLPGPPPRHHHHHHPPPPHAYPPPYGPHHHTPPPRGPRHRSGGPSSLPAMPPQTGSGGRLRVYSDFRTARVRIGSFEVVEPCTGRKNERDSRIRLYFNTSNEQSFGNPSMSARERALAEPDRLSITMYQGTKRMIIPVQDGLKKIVYNREKGHFRILTKGWALCEEIDPSVSPHPAPNKGTAFFRKCGDLTDGELEKSEGLIEVWVDKKNPLPMEPKWTRGNIRDYVDSRSKFRTQNILEVEDPEQINDFDGIVQLWVRESTISSVVERQHFVRNKLSRLEYILELSSKILAPPHYYVSKNTNTTNPQVASVLESGQIPALISPAISTLIATTVSIASKQAGMADDALMQSLKVVLFQAPEPIIWRALDGLFGKRNELLNFNPEKILELALERASASTPASSAPSTSNTPPVKHEDTYDDQQPNTNNQNDHNNDPPKEEEDEDDEVTYEA